jgi:hypothetical protein
MEEENKKKDKRISIRIRVISGIIGISGLLASAYNFYNRMDEGLNAGVFVKYAFIGFACFVFIYAALKGKNPL